MPNIFSLSSTSMRPKNSRKRHFTASFLALSCTLGASTAANANDWWFDVEVIVFKRDIATQSIAESFDHQVPKFASPSALDLLSDYISPNLTYVSAGLPVCSTSQASTEMNSEQQGDKALTLANEVFTQSDFSHFDNQTDALTPDATLIHAQLDSLDSVSNKDATSGTLDIDGEMYDQQNADSIDPQYTITAPQWINWQLPKKLPCSYAEDRILLAGPYDHLIPVSQPTGMPLNIDGVEWPNRQSAYLLPKSAQQLAKLEEKIRWQKDLTPILHVTWRQPVVFGRDKAQPLKLIAGENYALEFEQDGQRKIEKSKEVAQDSRFMAQEQALVNEPVGLSNNALFAQINAALNSPEPAKIVDWSQSTHDDSDTSIEPEDFTQAAQRPLWQLEGDFNVYLENLGRTPYLHIDSNLEFRAPITLRLPGETDVKPNNFLQSFQFDQLRRVISKQLHYFDHPLFGVVVQIRRYEPPKISDENLSE
tara:strand:+ start:1122 stop:2558 length:1437 start_codon:yes stop_codon:yes gene_type:complete